MLFNSFEFLLGFLPLVLVFFLILENLAGRARWHLLCAASLVFYAWWRPADLLIVCSSVLLNFLYATAFLSPWATTRILLRRLALWVGVGANLGALGWFKYRGFLALSGEVHALPLGISFFTFLQIAFLVDAWREGRQRYGLLDYGLFVTVFPHLIAGPLVHHNELIPQFAAEPRGGRRLWSDLSVGFTVLATGLAKKVLLADSMAPAADSMFLRAQGGGDIPFFMAWIGALAYTFQLYFDFSGYSDMAVGLARMFGIRLPANFNSPYKSASIIDFWRTWHITLSRFLRDYLYFSLGGNRRGSVARHFNLLVTMLLGGLWHGANWTFVVWGGLHGIYLIINHSWRKFARPIPRVAATALTFISVVVGWVFFRAESFGTAACVLRGMAGLSGFDLKESPIGFFPRLVLAFLRKSDELSKLKGLFFENLSLSIVMGTASVLIFLFPNTQEFMRRARPALTIDRSYRIYRKPKFTWRATPFWAVVVGGIFFFVMKTMLAAPKSAFLYFEF